MSSLAAEKPLPSTSSDATKSAHLCRQCARSFKDINNFREHLFQEHGEQGVNVRRCHLCSYATLLKSKYDCHIRCHLNNRVIRCQKCNYSTINIRHMSKHERQHSLSRMVLPETKRPRVEDEHTETERGGGAKLNNEQHNFSTCFLTDRILLPDDKKASEKSSHSRPGSSCSADDSYRAACSHRESLISLRSNVWTLLRMLLPQLALYYPSTVSADNEPDHSIDRLVVNLIQIPTFHRTYPAT